MGFIGLCLLVGVTAGAATRSSVDTWYAGLQKPPGTPPPLVFPIVWTALYVLMGTAAWLVWQHGSVRPVRHFLRRWGWQLLLNAAWTPAFFGLRSPALGLAVILPLLATVVWTARGFFSVQRVAGWMLVPYAAWVAYAAYLNGGILLLNW